MTAHPPPVPPEQQSDKAPASPSSKDSAAPKQGFDSPRRNIAEQGRTANTRQNTTNQGLQQDR